jgi:hypothetical protein
MRSNHLEKVVRHSVFCFNFYLYFRFKELEIQILNLFVKMTCILIHIYNILTLDTDGPFSAPRSRLQGISSYDMFIYDNLWLILHCANSVETVTPEDQGPLISCQLSFFLLML